MSNAPGTVEWVKSTYSGGEGQCIEWAPTHANLTGLVPVRDSKVPAGPALAMSTDAWTAFVGMVRS
ncbi:DUF397 domain-containing protein [Streptomyces sp. LP05-1]|uniref:DUF397 domain-containing protein n=1 Tax=Streptomyces pyxinae TaxID=2970734 RepID=A0ABT2CHW0_9ACTN|nr:DUF397 domain-containing protein [Streptomyces sp. LP05-1]MCS0636993.1 DUF397 domain-containing protein [Streptomyces sp. LP05-1]